MKHNIIFIVVFSMICMSFLIYFPFAFFGVVKWNSIDLGNSPIAKHYENVPFAKYQNFVEEYKTKITKVVTQQFPIYIDILKINTQTNKILNKFLYDSVFKEDYEFLPAFHNSQYNTFVNKNNEFIIRIENYGNFTEAMYKIDTSTNIINTLADNYPSININVYTVSDLGSNGLLNTVKDFIKTENWVETIQNSFNNNVNADYLKYNSLEEYRNYFFNSDHHWNYKGAYQGYLDIINLLEKTYSDIGEPLNINKYRYADENIKYRGSLARMAIDYDIYDLMFDGGIEMPPYQVTVNDGDISDNIYPNKELYFNGQINHEDFYGQYGNFFHGDYGQIHYQFNNGDRNLLIIADSISDCMDDLIASHFNNTYVIDLRLFNKFDFDSYVKEKNITDVLFLNLSTTMINSFSYNKNNFIK